MSIGDESWVEIVRASGHRLGPPCRASDLADLVFRLGTEVPQDLQRLYRLGNGVFDEPGQWWVIWPLDRVTETCSVAWADGSLPTNLIAFGDDGTGNPFCVARGAASSVVRWSWIDGDAEVDEGTFADFLSHWITRRHGHRSTTVTHEQERRFAVFVEQLNLIETTQAERPRSSTPSGFSVPASLPGRSSRTAGPCGRDRAGRWCLGGQRLARRGDVAMRGGRGHGNDPDHRKLRGPDLDLVVRTDLLDACVRLQHLTPKL